jgi:hypothetical protein
MPQSFIRYSLESEGSTLREALLSALATIDAKQSPRGTSEHLTVLATNTAQCRRVVSVRFGSAFEIEFLPRPASSTSVWIREMVYSTFEDALVGFLKGLGWDDTSIYEEDEDGPRRVTGYADKFTDLHVTINLESGDVTYVFETRQSEHHVLADMISSPLLAPSQVRYECMRGAK